MANSTSYKVSNSLFLVHRTIDSKVPAAPAEPSPVNHIIVLDCSGSMYYELPRIREQAKKRIPKLLRNGDTLTIIWFSGRKEFGVLLEAEPVATLTELKEVYNAIDRYLQPVGLTGFKEPIQEVGNVVERLAKKNSNPCALVFLSDGWDNQWPKGEILEAIEKSSAKVATTTIVEYGNYADRQLLTKMAEKAGGILIHSENFDKYAPMIEATVSRTVSGAPRISVPINGDAIGGFVFQTAAGDMINYQVDEGKVAVPEDSGEIWYLSPTLIDNAGPDLVDLSKEASEPGKDSMHQRAVRGAYAAVSLFSIRMQPNVVLPLLKALGDVQLIQDFGGCFGKQKYSEFMETAKKAAFDPKARFPKGWDPKKVPADDAFTVLQFLKVLSSDEENHVLLDSPDFKYARIGRPAVPVVMKDADGNEIPPLTFEADACPEGYSVSSLVYNEERANVSINIQKQGTVDLSKRIKGTGFEKKLGKTIRTFVYRSYAMIRDGIVNVDQLPVRMTAGTIRQLVKGGFPIEAILGLEGEDREKAVTRFKKASDDRPVSFLVDLRVLPVINRNMVQSASAKTLLEADWALTKARSIQKVFNTLKKERFPRESKGFKILYGEDCAKWLQEQGITDTSGFGPKTVQGEAQDEYMGKQLKVKLKGFSSVPSLKEASAKIASGKPTPAQALMVPAIEAFAAFEKSDTLKTAKDKDKITEAWLDDQASNAKAEARKLLYTVSQIRFSVIVGQVWFSEFASIDENKMSIDVDGKTIEGEIEMKEIAIPV